MSTLVLPVFAYKKVIIMFIKSVKPTEIRKCLLGKIYLIFFKEFENNLIFESNGSKKKMRNK